MFAKPINLILVYIVAVFNLAILTSPFLAALVAYVSRNHETLEIDDNIVAKVKLAACILIFLVSFFMLIYTLLDFLFGFSLRNSLKDCVRYEKLKDYDFLEKVFEDAKSRFGERWVKLYIKNSEEINAFAVGSISGKAIVLTKGLINHYLTKSDNPQEFLLAIRSVIGHEMSHLINKDFLPTYIIIANQKATTAVAWLVNCAFSILVKITRKLPYGGQASANLMVEACNIINIFIGLFNRVVVFHVYQFLRKFTSRSIEYRCDRQSAQAFGGSSMAFALAFLGEGGYFTLFSTHPGTKRRIKKVEKIELIDDKIRPKFIDSLSNYFAVMFMIIICLYFAKQAGIDLLLRDYLQDHETINRKLTMLWQLIINKF